jgi:hypothetical protein
VWFPNDRAFDLFAQLAAQQQKFTWGRSLPAGPSIPGRRHARQRRWLGQRF